MPKFKVILVYEHREVFEIEADNEEDAFNKATLSGNPDEVWDTQLSDYHISEDEYYDN